MCRFAATFGAGARASFRSAKPFSGGRICEVGYPAVSARSALKKLAHAALALIEV
jgi:hypothetical protein